MLESPPLPIFLLDIDIAVHQSQKIIVTQTSLDPCVEGCLDQTSFSLLFDLGKLAQGPGHFWQANVVRVYLAVVAWLSSLSRLQRPVELDVGCDLLL